MLKKLCKCGRTIDATETVCSDCKRKANRTYDKYHRRNSSFYHSPEWREIRQVVKARCSGIDLYHYYKYGRIIPGTLAHHITELTEDRSQALSIGNLIWLSDGSHAEVHALYDRSQADKLKTQKILRKLIEQGEG